MSVEEATARRVSARHAGTVLVGLLIGVVVFAVIVGGWALHSSTSAINDALSDRQVTACRTAQRADIDQAIADKAAGDALLTRIRTEYDIARALGQNPDLGVFIARARMALASIDRAVSRQSAATDRYDRGADLAQTHPGAFLAGCRRGGS